MIPSISPSSPRKDPLLPLAGEPQAPKKVSRSYSFDSSIGEVTLREDFLQTMPPRQLEQPSCLEKIHAAFTKVWEVLTKAWDNVVDAFCSLWNKIVKTFCCVKEQKKPLTFEEQHDQTAKEIREAWEGVLRERKPVDEKRSKAAIKIQAMVRGYLVRKQMQENPQLEPIQQQSSEPANQLTPLPLPAESPQVPPNNPPSTTQSNQPLSPPVSVGDLLPPSAFPQIQPANVLPSNNSPPEPLSHLPQRPSPAMYRTPPTIQQEQELLNKILTPEVREAIENYAEDFSIPAGLKLKYWDVPPLVLMQHVLLNEELTKKFLERSRKQPGWEIFNKWDGFVWGGAGFDGWAQRMREQARTDSQFWLKFQAFCKTVGLDYAAYRGKFKAINHSNRNTKEDWKGFIQGMLIDISDMMVKRSTANESKEQ